MNNERLPCLIGEIARGNESAFEELFHATSNRLRRYLLRIVADEWTAEEVLQDVYRQVWMSAASWDPARACPTAWLYTIAKSRSFDALRRNRRSSVHVSLDDHIGVSTLCDPEEERERHALRHRMRLALGALPAKQREAIDLAFYEGYTHSEIASETGVPLGTVKTRIRSALSRIGETFSPGDLPRAA